MGFYSDGSPFPPPIACRQRVRCEPATECVGLYGQRHLVECWFSWLKQFRCVATRFEKAARNYLAIVTLAAMVLWLR